MCNYKKDCPKNGKTCKNNQNILVDKKFSILNKV